MSRFVILFVRYIAAIMLACAAAVASSGPLYFILMILSFRFQEVAMFFPYFAHALLSVMSFCGVYSGCLCLEPTSRRVGSIVLLVLGLAYFVHEMGFLRYREGEDEAHPHVRVVGLAAIALGGLVAVKLVFRKSSPNTALEPTPTAPKF